MALTFAESLALTQIATGDTSNIATPGYGAADTTEVGTYDDKTSDGISYNKNYPIFDVFKDNSISVIDINKGVSVNSNQFNLTQEQNSQYIPFSISRYCDGYDLFDGIIWIITDAGENKEAWPVRPVNVYVDENGPQDKVYFGWLVDGYITRTARTITFEIHIHGQIQGVDGEETVRSGYVWKSKPGSLTVTESKFNLDETIQNALENKQDGWLDNIIVEAVGGIVDQNIKPLVSRAETAADNAETAASNVTTAVQTFIEETVPDIKTDMQTAVSEEISLKVQEITWDKEIPAILGYNYKATTDESGFITDIDITVADYVSDKIGNLGQRENENGELVDIETVAEAIENVDVTLSQEISETYATKTEVSDKIGNLGQRENEEGNLVDITVADHVAQELENYYTKNDIDTLEIEIEDIYATKTNVETVIGDLGMDSEGNKFTTVAAAIKGVDVTSQLNALSEEVANTYATKASLGDLGTKEDGTAFTVAEAIANVDITDSLGELGQNEDGSDKTVKQYVDEAIENVDVTLKQEISETYATKADLGNVKVDLTDYATTKFVTDITDPLTTSVNQMKDTVDKIDISPRKTYTVDYDNTEDNNVGKNVFVLYEIENENTENEIKTIKRKFQISGGGGSGGTLNKLYVYYDTNAAGKEISSYVFTKDHQAENAAIIFYRFYGVDPTDQAIGYGNATWKIRKGVTGSYQTVKTETIYPGDKRSFNISEYLDNVGSYWVQLEVTDDSAARVIKTWAVQLIELKIDSSFNDKIPQPLGQVRFNYKPFGTIKKDVHFILDGEEIPGSPVTTTAYDTELFQMLPAQEYGSYLLEVYMTAEIQETIVESNHIFKDILWHDENNSEPVIGCAHRDFATRQYDTTNIEYTVYDPKTQTPTVQIFVDEKLVSTQTLTEATNIYSFKTDVVGEHEIKIVCGNTVKILKATVSKIDIDLPVDSMPVPVFDFNPSGKSNNDVDRLWSDGDIHMTVSDNFDWINGGYQIDDKGDQYFCIKAGTSAEIDYNLFANEAKINGKEFKLIFKTTNVAKSNATFLKCLDGLTGSDNIGVQMDVHEAFVYSKVGKLHLPYSEEDIIEFEFNITKDTSDIHIPMVMGYEDGVSTCPMIYDGNHMFVQNTPKPISLGSPHCDLHIYRFKVYDTELSDINILNNFILDARNAEEMIARYDRNQIKDDNGILDPNILMEKCPWLRIIQIEAPHFTNGKKYPINNTTIQYTYPEGKDLGLKDWKWKATDCVHVGQGTSSDDYGAAGRNIDLVLKTHKDYNNSPVITLEDGSVVNKVALTANSIATNYFNIKVNIASSENANNALLQKRYNEFNPYNRAFVRDSEEEIAKIKDTMEFFNCVVFIRETDPDLSAHKEFNDTNWHFYSIGNIGDSKKTDKTRLTDPTDPYECIVEIMDIGRPLCDFPEDTMMNAMGHIVDKDTQEKIYTWAKDENLDILYEKIGDKYVKTTDLTVDLNKTYYVDILEHDDFSEKYTYGWRYLFECDESDVEDVDAANQEIFDYCKQKWIELYRFVTTSTNEEFEEHFGDYFVLNSALYYYLFTTRYTMVDNRAKNSFWHYGKTGEVDADGNPIRKWDLSFDYDNDTALGINNYGAMVYRYGLEDTHVDENGSEIFRESDSTFFCRVRDRFDAQLKEMYNDLEIIGAWRAESTSGVSGSKGLINQFDEWQDQFPEELWRLDIERKYIRTYNSSHVNGEGDPQFLVDMAHGKKKYQRRQYERGQEKYMASKYQSSTASSDDSSIVIRCGAVPEGNSVVTPNYSLTLTPYDYMYLNVEYSSGVIQVPVTEPGKPITVPFSGDKTDIIKIYSGYSIESLGDLSPIYPRTIAAGVASKLKELIIGNSTSGYNNPFLTTLKTSEANGLLEKINIENVTGFTEASLSLDLSALKNLRELYAQGSNITGVIFANGGRIEIAELPALDSIRMKNLAYLTRFDVVDFSKLTSLTVENCDSVDLLTILNKANNLNWVRLINVNWTGENALENTSLLERLYNLKGYDKDNHVTNRSVLTGQVYVLSIKQSEFNKYTSEEDGWGEDLIITYPQSGWTPQHLVLFENRLEDGTEPVAEQWVDDGGYPVVPNETPEKPSTVDTVFTFEGWANPSDPLTIVDVTKEIVFGPTIYVAVYSSAPRRYTVSYAMKINNQETLLSEPVTAPYGSVVEYTGEIPTYTLNENDRWFYWFTGWDKSGYVDGDKTIYAKFDTFHYAGNWKETDFSEMRPVEVYALSRLIQMGLLEYSEEEERILDTRVELGDSFTFTMGYDVEYTDIESYTIVKDPIKFDGNTAIEFNGEIPIYKQTDEGEWEEHKLPVSLFDVDKDFVLALDYKMSSENISLSGNPTIMQCYSSTGPLSDGFRLRTAKGTSQPKIIWGEDTNAKDVSAADRREMIVLRHKKGDGSLYVYSSALNSFEIQYDELKKEGATNTVVDTYLILGGTKQNNSFINKCQGEVNWCKIWYTDLGDAVCRKIASWPREEISLNIDGFYRYYLSDGSGGKSTISLLGSHLLDLTKPIVVSNDGNTSAGGWAESLLNQFLNTKFYPAIPDTIRPLLKKVVVKSTAGNKSQEITSSDCYVTIPAIFDIVDSDTMNSNNLLQQYKNFYFGEVSDENGTIKFLNGNEARRRAHSNGDYASYWTRSPNLSVDYGWWHVVDGKDVGDYDEPGGFAGYKRGHNQSLGILIEISV